jgi:ABC-type phosphate transport system substrate-binding protein
LFFDAMNTLKPLRSLLMPLLLAASTWAGAGGWVVVGNPKAGIARLTQDEVINIYLGRYRRLASGITAEPIDQSADSTLKVQFYRQLVGKSLAEINAYWARLVFSGKTQPPRVVTGSDEAIQRVARHPGALAYIERSQVDSRVTVVFEMRGSNE